MASAKLGNSDKGGVVRLIYVQESLLPSMWHRIDADVIPMPSRAICGHDSAVQKTSDESAPWAQVWRRTAIDPPGDFCQGCHELARRLAAPLSSLLGSDINILLDSL